MGEFNSSTTRVERVFGRLFAHDARGAGWLPTLLNVGQHGGQSNHGPLFVEGHAPTWGRQELSLPAPLGLLEHLITTITVDQVESSGDKGPVLALRRKLASRDPETVETALREVRAGSRGRKWCVLEGPSRPDATLEMSKSVLVVEGKRTERSCTSKTKWMRSRSQLLRHMDAATERYPNKRILGLLIVEGDGGADAIEPSEHWRREAAAQTAPTMLESSLPHRAPDVRKQIAAGILGVITWQYICAVHRIPWPPG